MRACLIRGDGVGPELTAAAQLVVAASGAAVEWEELLVGAAAHERGGEALPESAVAAIRDCGLALKGPLASRPEDPFRSVNVQLRERLDLYLGVRPSRSWPGTGGRYEGVDLALLRMHAGDLYAGFDYGPEDEVASAIRAAVDAAGGETIAADAGITLKPISRAAALRAARAAFAWARENDRRSVLVVHKANVMRASDGTFLAAAREAAAEFPELSVSDALVDRVSADLVRDPGRFDVLLAPMLYGDVLSDLAAALCGGLGLAPGANLGDGCAVFEAVHGTAPRHAGAGSANPTALILSAAMMLRHGGESEAADRVEAAVAATLRDGVLTRDLLRDGGEPVSTERMAEAIAERLR